MKKNRRESSPILPPKMLHAECETGDCGEVVCACECGGCRPVYLTRNEELEKPVTRRELFGYSRRMLAITLAAAAFAGLLGYLLGSS